MSWMTDAPASLDVLELKVVLRGFRIEAEIGLHPHERGVSQPLVIDLTLTLQPRLVHGLADVVDYESVSRKARSLAARGHIELVEDYAQALAAACLEDPRVREVELRVEKPDAIEGALGAGVILKAGRPS
jgi:dihydroneopterin aldolase